jgi:hypothetical protein
MTWALVIFTAVMAVAAIAVGVAVTATESVSEADIQACMAQDPFFAGAPTREECEEELRVADEDVGAIFVLWLVGFQHPDARLVQAPTSFSVPISPF